MPTRESIVDARAYSDLAKLDLAALGGNLTWPFIGAAGGQVIALVCWIASRMVASECQIMVCDASTTMIKIERK